MVDHSVVLSAVAWERKTAGPLAAATVSQRVDVMAFYLADVRVAMMAWHSAVGSVLLMVDAMAAPMVPPPVAATVVLMVIGSVQKRAAETVRCSAEY
jgi:hypothetical protein